MCYIGVTEGKIENLKKECKMRISILIFITQYLKCTQNFIILNQVVAEKTDQKNSHMCYIGVTEGKLKKKAK